MKKQNLVFLLAITIGVASVFEGCKKREQERFDSTTNNSEALAVFDDMYEVIAEAAEEQPDLNKMENGNWALGTAANCASVTLSPLGSDFPKTLTIDFGDGCLGIDNRYRSGQIVCEFSGPYRQQGTVITVDLVDYELDNYEVDVHHIGITNNGVNGSNQLNYTIEVHNASISNEDGTATWSSTRTRTWVEGSETTWFTPDTTQPLGIMGLNGLLDDVYHITGGANGTTRGGVPYTATINEPLEVQVGCRWVQAGVLLIAPQNLDERTIDFGDGTCDSGASLEVNGNTYNFTMW